MQRHIIVVDHLIQPTTAQTKPLKSADLIIVFIFGKNTLIGQHLLIEKLISNPQTSARRQSIDDCRTGNKMIVIKTRIVSHRRRLAKITGFHTLYPPVILFKVVLSENILLFERTFRKIEIGIKIELFVFQ